MGLGVGLGRFGGMVGGVEEMTLRGGGPRFACFAAGRLGMKI